jgi:tRNA(Ile)-lysidine synthetase-like protein
MPSLDSHPSPSLIAALGSLPTRFLVGVSGGRDSCALLDALVASGRKPVVVHFDHRWRKESAADARWVAALAKRHGLACVTGRAPAGSPKTETAARRLRWAFFATAARKKRCRYLVLAHHAGDQAETFLLQLLRGTGSGWAGMASETVRDGLTVHRPWLGIEREEINSYTTQRTLAWREDPSNAELHPLRNRIRHHLLPLLEAEYAPGIEARLVRSAEIRRGEEEWLSSLVEAEARSATLPLKALQGRPVGFQRRLLHAWLSAQGVADLSFSDIEAARRLLSQPRPSRINLSRGRHLRRRSGVLFVEG